MASSTHDTKRGEDARARLYTLSEAPDEWAILVAEAARALQPFRKELADGLVSPDPATEWGFYQSLLGVLPADFDPADGALREAIGARLGTFMEKAVREAKRYTSWTAAAEDYEGALQDFAKATMSAAASGDFLSNFWQGSQAFVAAGALNSLSQTLIKLTAPGVPDIYQGTEVYDFSLVDPDNRRKIDFPARSKSLASGATFAGALAGWRDGEVKAILTAIGLKARAQAPELFTKGNYIPLEVTGERAQHVLAFARRDEEGRAALVVAPRLTLALLGGATDTILPVPERWGDTAIRLGGGLEQLQFSDRLGRGDRPVGETLLLRDLLADAPLALLTTF